MSQTYSTGDLAKLAGVSVRTVQYYDKRGILEPSQLSQGGRRIYSESDLEQLQIICFLREIKKVMAEANASQVLTILLEDNIASLKQDMAKRKSQLDTLKGQSGQSLKLVSDMTIVMDNQKNWRRLQLKW